jgi:hypothetical protein
MTRADEADETGETVETGETGETRTTAAATGGTPVPRPAAGHRGNPGPRQALARVRPLAADADVTDTPPGGAAAGPAPSAPEPAGRDVLIPEGGRDADPEPKHGHRKRSGAAAAAVPSVADLMPKAEVAAAVSVRHVRDVRPVAPAPAPGSTAAKPATRKAKSTGKPGKGEAKQVELVVPLSKALRKRLRERAAELGVPAEEAVARLVEVWVDG